MIKTREQLRAEADADVAEFAELIAADQSETTGIPRPPNIEVTEIILEPEHFDFGIIAEPEATVDFVEGGGGGSEPTCCPTATLVCDQISAGKSKCGFSEYGTPSDPPKIYLVETYNSLQTISPLSCLDSNPNFTCDPGLNCIASRTITYDPVTCDSDTVGSADPGCLCGSNVAHEDLCDGTVIDPSGDCPDQEVSIRFNGTTTQTTINYTPADTHHNNVGCTPVDVTLHLDGHISLSDEYTTETLISNTIDDLPPYDDDFDDPCVALRDLSEDETDYSISRFQYKFTIASPQSNDCLISWIEQTLDEDSNIVDEEIMSDTIPAGELETPVHEALEPDENGIKIIVYPIGACCKDGNCTTRGQTDCESDGGTFDGPSCSEDACDGVVCP